MSYCGLGTANALGNHTPFAGHAKSALTPEWRLSGREMALRKAQEKLWKAQDRARELWRYHDSITEIIGRGEGRRAVKRRAWFSAVQANRKVDEARQDLAQLLHFHRAVDSRLAAALSQPLPLVPPLFPPAVVPVPTAPLPIVPCAVDVRHIPLIPVVPAAGVYGLQPWVGVPLPPAYSHPLHTPAVATQASPAPGAQSPPSPQATPPTPRVYRGLIRCKEGKIFDEKGRRLEFMRQQPGGEPILVVADPPA